MKNLKIGKKLLVSFGVVVVLIVILGASAIFGLNRMDSVVTQYSEKTVPNTDYIWQIRRNVLSVQRYMLRTIAAPTPEESEKMLVQANSEVAVLKESFKSYRHNMRTDVALMDAVEKGWEEVEVVRKNLEEISTIGTAEANARAYEMLCE